MGVYYRVVNLDKRELLDSPYSAKEREWNCANGRSANVVLWTLWRRWNGDRIAVFHDCGGESDYHEQCAGWPDIWREMEADYLRHNGPWREAPETKEVLDSIVEDYWRRFA